MPFDFTKVRQDLARAVQRVCPTWDAVRRDDLVQAAAMRVMQAVERAPAPDAEEETRFATSYLYKVAHSVLIDEIRLMRRRREDELPPEVAATVAGAGHGPERVAASREVGRAIQACLTRLLRDRRLAVTLYLQGHTVPDAARRLDWSAKRTENLVYRGLADLRDCLSSKGIRP